MDLVLPLPRIAFPAGKHLQKVPFTNNTIQNGMFVPLTVANHLKIRPLAGFKRTALCRYAKRVSTAGRDHMKNILDGKIC